jgi:GntR family transcriptional regulator/MocR family aminotransferase
VLDQLALAELIDGGDFDRHVRRMRRTYRRRRDEVIGAVSAAAPSIRIQGTEAGLHAVLELPNGVSEQELLSAAGERELEVHGLAPYRHGSYEGPEALVVGYGAPAEHAFPGSLRALASLLRTSVATVA